MWKTFDVLLGPLLPASIYMLACMYVHALQEGIATYVCMNKLLQQTDKLYIIEALLKLSLGTNSKHITNNSKVSKPYTRLSMSNNLEYINTI